MFCSQFLCPSEFVLLSLLPSYELFLWCPSVTSSNISPLKAAEVFHGKPSQFRLFSFFFLFSQYIIFFPYYTAW